MQTGSLNIFPSTWYYGSNFEHLADPIKHTSDAKLILFDANKPGHSMDQVIGVNMNRTGYIILNIMYDSSWSTGKLLLNQLLHNSTLQLMQLLHEKGDSWRFVIMS